MKIKVSDENDYVKIVDAKSIIHEFDAEEIYNKFTNGEYNKDGWGFAEVVEYFTNLGYTFSCNIDGQGDFFYK